VPPRAVSIDRLQRLLEANSQVLHHSPENLA
jgi:hypothetical protein